jgi:hypothetical protein
VISLILTGKIYLKERKEGRTEGKKEGRKEGREGGKKQKE